MATMYFGQMKPYIWRHTKNGIFYVIWMQYGAQKRRSLKTKDATEARKKFKLFCNDLVAGKIKAIQPKSKIRLSEFAAEFLAVVAEKKNSQTHRTYRDALNKAQASWGDTALSSITERHIDSLVVDMLQSGLSPATANKHIRSLKVALKKAVAWEYLSKPVRFPTQLSERERQRFLSEDELARILAVMDKSFADMTLFAIATGLRSGEIVRLTWNDIDSPHGFLRVTNDQKNKDELRVPINADARAILEAIPHRVGKVFCYRSIDWISRRFQYYARKAGVTGHKFHDLRHSYATELVNQGVDIRTIQALMRHKSIQSTLKYAKVRPDHLKEAAEKVRFGRLRRIK